jgi:hypothetical protein
MPTMILEPGQHRPPVHRADPTNPYDSDFPTLRFGDVPTASHETSGGASGSGDERILTVVERREELGQAALVVPHAVAVLWSALALVACGFAFVAGWLLGRGV